MIKRSLGVLPLRTSWPCDRNSHDLMISWPLLFLLLLGGELRLTQLQLCIITMYALRFTHAASSGQKRRMDFDLRCSGVRLTTPQLEWTSQIHVMLTKSKEWAMHFRISISS